nr:hypothetical protein [Solemya velesiana gill symbiont]
MEFSSAQGHPDTGICAWHPWLQIEGFPKCFLRLFELPHCIHQVSVIEPQVGVATIQGKGLLKKLTTVWVIAGLKCYERGEVQGMKILRITLQNGLQHLVSLADIAAAPHPFGLLNLKHCTLIHRYSITSGNSHTPPLVHTRSI